MKPLKILLGNNTLSLLAGSETHTMTLARELKRLGHTVHCFSPNLGIISDTLIDEDIPCFDHFDSGVKPFSVILEEKIDHNYDVIIANHNQVVRFLRSQFPKTPVISTIHGIIHMDGDQEAPEHPALDAGVNQFVAVSEEIQGLLRKEYNIDSMVVRNFIDVKHFDTRKKPDKAIKQILFNSNYNTKDDDEVKILREVAKHYGAHLAAVGQNFVQTMDTKKTIESSDIVIGMGRSLLEGMAMGRLGIVHGRWGFGGVVNELNIEELRSVNFSGRNAEGATVTAQELIERIDQFYKPAVFEWTKNYIRRDHNAVFAAEIYVKMARELLGQNIIKLDDSRRPYRRAKDVQRTS